MIGLIIQPLINNYKNQTLSDMKQSIFFMLFLMLSCTAFTQNAPSKINEFGIRSAEVSDSSKLQSARTMDFCSGN